MRLRLPPYALLLLVACAGTEVGNPTFACGTDSAKGERIGGGGSGGGYYPGDGGTGGASGSGGDGRGECAADGTDCGLAVEVSDFGDPACPGGTARARLLLLNLTNGPVSGSIEATPDLTVAPATFELPAGAEGVHALLHRPGADATSGFSHGTLEVLLADGTVRWVQVPLQLAVSDAAEDRLEALCEGEAPCDVLAFGEVPVGTTATRAVTLVNDGCAAVELLAPEVGEHDRVVVRSEAEFPATLAPGEQLEVEVDFTPVTLGPTSGTIWFGTAADAVRLLPWSGAGR